MAVGWPDQAARWWRGCGSVGFFFFLVVQLFNFVFSNRSVCFLKENNCDEANHCNLGKGIPET